jgi:hypothetical protein
MIETAVCGTTCVAELTFSLPGADRQKMYYYLDPAGTAAVVSLEAVGSYQQLTLQLVVVFKQPTEQLIIFTECDWGPRLHVFEWDGLRVLYYVIRPGELDFTRQHAWRGHPQPPTPPVEKLFILTSGREVTVRLVD